LKCGGTRAETRFRLSAKRMSPFKSAGASVHSTTGSRGMRISGSNAGYTMFRGSVKGTGYPLHLNRRKGGVSVQSTTDSRGVRISGSNAGYTMFPSSVKGTGYPLHSPVSPSLPVPCVTMCHHISTGVYHHVEEKKFCSCLTQYICMCCMILETNNHLFPTRHSETDAYEVKVMCSL